MAVSNVLGSNVFNIFLGFGVPWLIYAAVEEKPYSSPGLRGDIIFPVAILFLYILLLLGVLVAAKWKLYPRVGYVLILLHLLFLAWVLLTSPLGPSPPVIVLPTIQRGI